MKTLINGDIVAAAVNRVRLLAALTRKQFPELANPRYKPPQPKGKKKKKKVGC
jgi:hypothetical protein